MQWDDHSKAPRDAGSVCPNIPLHCYVYYPHTSSQAGNWLRGLSWVKPGSVKTVTAPYGISDLWPIQSSFLILSHINFSRELFLNHQQPPASYQIRHERPASFTITSLGHLSPLCPSSPVPYSLALLPVSLWEICMWEEQEQFPQRLGIKRVNHTVFNTCELNSLSFCPTSNISQ